MSIFRLELTSSVVIRASPAETWSVFSDVGRWPEWCRVCIAAYTEVGFDWNLGQRIGLRFRMARVGVPFNVVLTDVDAPESVSWSSTKFTVTAVRTFTFAETTPGMTTVTDHKLFTSPVLPLRLFYPRPIIRRMSESMLADLKLECERAERR